MNKGQCKLCLRTDQDLQRSHFLGKALYRLNREGGQPIMMTPQLVIPTDRQLWAHLLCYDCEQHFRANGEDLAMRLVQRKNSFSLLARLELALPEETDGKIKVYSGRRVGVDTDKLAYFALSVMWRSGVRKWETLRQQTSGIELGPYLEPIREYLVGTAGFPSGMAVLLTVATDFGSQNMVLAPWRSRLSAYPSYGLLTRGIWFRAFMHPNLPSAVRERCCVGSARKLLFVENCEPELLRLFAAIDSNAAVAPSLQNLASSS